jgi:hypothetical protein
MNKIERSGKSKNKSQKTKKGEKTMKRIIISMILIFSLMSVFSYGWFYANWPCLLYSGQCPPENTNKSSIQSLSPSLGQLSIEAAGFFLQSNSDYQAFLKKIELAEIYGLNDDELIELITSAIENMEMAQSIYYQVWQLSKSLERNPVVLKKLAKFDYRIFLEDKRLIPSIFNEVEKYLKKGNMPGAFEKIYNDTGDILELMISLKSIKEANSIDIPLCWEVNQRLLESALFGQYISQVFSKIKQSIM